MLARFPDQPKIWMSYGHVLKTVGRLEDGIAAYRRALAVAPALGEVWWSLANLKTVRLGAGRHRGDERRRSARPACRARTCFHLHFALGKAHDDAGERRARLRAIMPRATGFGAS